MLALTIVVRISSTSVNAAQIDFNEVHELTDTIPGLDNPLTRDGNPPDISTDTVWDLRFAEYKYSIEEVGAQVYTDVFLTGKTSIKVTVGDMKVVSSESADKLYRTTVTLYDSNGTSVASTNITTNGNYTFTGLSATKKYYVKFSVRHDTTIWTWDGSIK